jgi:hypothetical protein
MMISKAIRLKEVRKIAACNIHNVLLLSRNSFNPNEKMPEKFSPAL